MGFLNGRVGYVRFAVSGAEHPLFEEEDLDKVREHLIGKHGGGEATDGVTIGWAGGDHVLDETVEYGKNVVNDALHLSIRVDSEKPPASLLRAYTRMETDARAKTNPSGFPTKAQRQEAKEAAVHRLEAEAADGRFLKRSHSPILWDGRSGMLYVGASSAAVIERMVGLFRETFDRTLEPVTAGVLAHRQAFERGEAGIIENCGPVGFVNKEGEVSSVAWTDSDASSRDFLGNEFLLWLWHKLQVDGDEIPLADGSEVTVMLAKTLTLDCPQGLTGRDQLTDEGPTRLPEAFRAIQSGKLPRRAGLVLVRHEQQYDLTLQAETLAVSGAALPKVSGDSIEAIRWGRVDALRHLVETLDLLYDAFGRGRTGPEWNGEVSRIRRWLAA